MSKGVTEAQIEEFRKSFDSDPSATVAQNAVSNADPVSYTHLTLPTSDLV